LVFRNYVPFDESFKRENMEHFQHVTKVEKMYQRKVKKSIKEYLKSENDPVSNLVPKKTNIDLKRNLSLKLERLNRQTDKSIIEILSKSSCCDSIQLTFLCFRGITAQLEERGGRRPRKLVIE